MTARCPLAAREHPRLRSRHLTSGRPRACALLVKSERIARSILPRGRRSTGRVACVTLAYGPPRCGGSAPGGVQWSNVKSGVYLYIGESRKEREREKEHDTRHKRERERAREITELKSAVSRSRALARVDTLGCRLSGVRLHVCAYVCARAGAHTAHLRRSIFVRCARECVCVWGTHDASTSTLTFRLGLGSDSSVRHLDTIRFILDIVLAGEFRRRARDARQRESEVPGGRTLVPASKRMNSRVHLPIIEGDRRKSLVATRELREC